MTTKPLGAAVRYLRTLTDHHSAVAAADGQLLNRFVRLRDEAAFAALLRRHGPMVLAVCRRVLGRYQDAEDAFQATFLLLARKASSIRKRESVGGWLHGVARRLALKAKGRDDRRRMNEERLGSMRKTETGVQAAWGDLREALDEALQRLPEHYRTALVICHLEGRTHEEAARQLGCPTATLRSRLTRGRKLLRTELIRRGLTLSVGALGAALMVSTAEAAPTLLLDATLKAALLFAAGKTTAGAVSTTAVALANESMKAMGIMKTKIVVMLLAALSLVGIGVGVMAQPDVKPPDAKRQAEPPRKDEAQVRVDDYGDPLPDGAVRRVGTLRFHQGGGFYGHVIPSPDGKTLLSGFINGNRTICTWDLATGKLLHSFPTGSDQTLFALSADGRVLVESHQSEWVIHLWDVGTGKELPRLQRADGCFPDSFAFSPDGKTLAVGSSQWGVFLWDLTTGKHTKHLKTPNEMIRAIAFTPDGKTLIASAGNTIIQWDAASYKELRTLTRPKELFRLALSPDGALLATSSANGGKTDDMALWDMKSGKVVREWPVTASVTSFVFSPDGKTLVSGEFDGKGDTIVLRDVSGNERRFNAPGVVAVAFSTDGKTLISGHLGGTIRLWDADTFTERAPATAGRRMSDAILSPDGRTLAFIRDKERCFDDREIRLWDMTAGREIGGFPTERWAKVGLTFAPDGKTLAAVNNTVIYLLDVDARKSRREFHQRQLANSYISAMAFAPDGKALVTGEGDGSVRLWVPADGKELRRIIFKNSEKADDKYQMDVVQAVGFSPDGRALAALGWTPRYGVRVSVWDCETGGEAPQLAWNATTPDMPDYGGERSYREVRPMRPSFLFTPDAHMLAVSRCQKTIPIWEAASGRQRLLLTGHQAPCNTIAMTRDGRTLASSGCDNTIRLWDLETGEELRTLTGHRGPANSLVFSADGKTLVSAGNDTTMLFWDVAAVTHRPKPKAIVLSPEECKSLWTDLANADAANAYKAIRAFSAAPAQTASFLGERLRPARSAPKEEVDRLIADLDSDDFTIRDKATSELEELGDAVQPVLRKVIDGQPSAEVRSRVNRLLEKLATPTPALLRHLRALEALEAVGGAEARRVVEKIAKGDAEARLTREAKASLKRMGG